MSKTYMTLTDHEGRPFLIDTLDFYRQLENNGFLLFGMDFPCLLEMRKQYQLRRGPIPPTPESIQAAFEQP